MAGLALEDFDVALADIAAESVVDSGGPMPETGAGDAARTDVFEEGYRAGWDDAVRAQSEDQTRIGAEFERNLQELSFTFHEARAHVIQSMEPLLTQLTDTVFPGLLAEALAATVLEELQPLIADAADAPIELVVGPGGQGLLEAQVSQVANAAIRLVEEPSLAEGQAYLRVGKAERQVDLSGALDRIRAAIAALYELNERTLKHG